MAREENWILDTHDSGSGEGRPTSFAHPIKKSLNLMFKGEVAISADAAAAIYHLRKLQQQQQKHEQKNNLN